MQEIQWPFGASLPSVDCKQEIAASLTFRECGWRKDAMLGGRTLTCPFEGAAKALLWSV